jgi:hypothetical protein
VFLLQLLEDLAAVEADIALEPFHNLLLAEPQQLVRVLQEETVFQQIRGEALEVEALVVLEQTKLQLRLTELEHLPLEMEG